MDLAWSALTIEVSVDDLGHWRTGFADGEHCVDGALPLLKRRVWVVELFLFIGRWAMIEVLGPSHARGRNVLGCFQANGSNQDLSVSRVSFLRQAGWGDLLYSVEDSDILEVPFSSPSPPSKIQVEALAACLLVFA